ncbi:MAG: SGNH/GDSL hydrolase family protein, partial [Nitrospinota bacterium]
FYFDGDQLMLDLSFRDSAYSSNRRRRMWRIGQRLINHSRILQVVNEVRTMITYYRIKANRGALLAKGENNFGLELDNMVYKEPRDSSWKDAWRVTEALLVLMRNEVLKRGAEFLVVTLTNAIQVHPDPSVRRAFMEKMGIDSLVYPDLRIKALGERERFRVLNLVEYFQPYAERHGTFLHGFGADLGRGHWNVEGHRLGGERMGREICKLAISKAEGE